MNKQEARKSYQPSTHVTVVQNEVNMEKACLVRNKILLTYVPDAGSISTSRFYHASVKGILRKTIFSILWTLIPRRNPFRTNPFNLFAYACDRVAITASHTGQGRPEATVTDFSCFSCEIEPVGTQLPNLIQLTERFQSIELPRLIHVELRHGFFLHCEASLPTWKPPR
jgi:hypothetical protein